MTNFKEPSEDPDYRRIMFEAGSPIKTEFPPVERVNECDGLHSIKENKFLITKEMIDAAAAFYGYGATRGNYKEDGSLGGPLSKHIHAMGDLVRLLNVVGGIMDNNNSAVVQYINDLATQIQKGNGVICIDDLPYQDDDFPPGFWRKLAKEVNYIDITGDYK